MRYPGFVGPSVPSRARTVNHERTVNLYVEGSRGTPKHDPSLLIRPATRSWSYCAPGPVRALFWQDGRMFAVSGGWCYEVLSSRQVTILGQVALDARPATISSNGTGGFQLFITSGGLGYIFDLSTNSFQQITDPEFPVPCDWGGYLDSYFVAKQAGTNQFQISALLDGLTWSGLDVAQASLSSDRKVAMAISHRELWFLGTKNTEVWYNSGNASFPFEPIEGVFVEHGIAAQYSVANLDNTIYWLGLDSAGQGIVWRANGYTPERISDHALEHNRSTWATLSDALGFAFQLGGHAWYALVSPHNDTTWIYDVGQQTWTEWAQWDERLMRFVPWVGRSAASGWGHQFIGDRQSGMIYTLTLDEYQDRLVWL